MNEITKIKANCLTRVVCNGQLLGYVNYDVREEYIDMMIKHSFITEKDVAAGVDYQTRMLPFANEENY
jgi:hypothetical protein